jgi:hypothetical protein
MIKDHFTKYLNHNLLNKNVPFSNVIFYDNLITNFIIFLIIAYALYPYNKKLSYYIIIQGIISSIGDSHILKKYNLNQNLMVLIDRYFATLTFILLVCFYLKQRRFIIYGFVSSILGLYFLHKSRKTTDIYEYKLYSYLWHLMPLSFFVLFIKIK